MALPPKRHEALPQRGLLPGTPIVATGVLDADRLVASQHDDGGDPLGPTRGDDHGQARQAAGFEAQPFQSDGDQRHATCPAGKVSTGWTPARETRGSAGIEGTTSRGRRSTRLRRPRSRGLARVHLGHLLTAAGLTVRRLGDWFLETSRANTRITPVARLMAASAAA